VRELFRAATILDHGCAHIATEYEFSCGRCGCGPVCVGLQSLPLPSILISQCRSGRIGKLALFLRAYVRRQAPACPNPPLEDRLHFRARCFPTSLITQVYTQSPRSFSKFSHEPEQARPPFIRVWLYKRVLANVATLGVFSALVFLVGQVLCFLVDRERCASAADGATRPHVLEYGAIMFLLEPSTC